MPITIKVSLKKYYTNSNGEHPVTIRINYNGKRKRYSIQDSSGTLFCHPDKWNSDAGLYLRNPKKNKFIMEYLQKVQDTIDQIDPEYFSFKIFEDNMKSGKSDTSIVPFFMRIIKDLEKNNKHSTAIPYHNTLSRIKVFFGSNIQWQDINSISLKRLEKFLRSNGNSTNTISLYMRTLRAAYNRAITEGIIKKDIYPFNQYKIRNEKTMIRALNKNQIHRMFNYKVNIHSREYLSLLYFKFSYYCRGMNFKDMCEITWDKNIIGDKLVYYRAKTSYVKQNVSPIVIKLEDTIAEILMEFRSNDIYVFPIYSTNISDKTKYHRRKSTLKKINKDLKKIAKEVNIPEYSNVTFYWARHTYATALKRAGVPISVISQALNHSNESVTEAYLDKFGDDVIDDTYKYL